MMDRALWDAMQAGVGALGAPLFLAAAAIATLLCDIADRKSLIKGGTGIATFFGVLGAGAIAIRQALDLAAAGNPRLGELVAPALLWGGGVVNDGFAAGVNLVIAVAALLSLMMAGSYLKERGLPRGEFNALILFAAAGAMVMAQSADLVNLFVGLEVLSVALYILAGFARRDRKSEEAALKYFLLGAFASGFLLYGIALIYGAVGLTASALNLTADHSLTNLATISELLQKSAGSAQPLVTQPLFVVGVALVLVGLGFKAALVPFHSYAPDVYEGAPAPVAAFMSAVAKLGAFAGLLRLMQPILSQGESASLFRALLWGVALLTMLIGNLSAVRQTNLKRMLACSSIAHAGYVLVGVLAGSTRGGGIAAEAVLFYLFAYTLMNLGAFSLTLWLGARGDEVSEISELSGLARRHPLAAGLMTVFLLSLSGLPPTAGFFGKLYLFIGAYKAGFVGLAVTGLLLSGLGLFYYLNIVVKMYFEDGDGRTPEPVRPDARRAAILAGVATIFFGLVPPALLAPRTGLVRPPAPVTASEETERAAAPDAAAPAGAPSH